MFAIDCPYCHITNTPGARFCKDCGAALHLRPCPGCGKVDDVSAKTCLSCGLALPPLKLADEGSGSDKKIAATVSDGRRTDDKKSHVRALPLVMVALVAGGLPLFWMNRAYLPLPKAWRGAGQEAAGNPVSPPPAFSGAAGFQSAPAAIAPPLPSAAVVPPAVMSDTKEQAVAPIVPLSDVAPKPSGAKQSGAQKPHESKKTDRRPTEESMSKGDPVPPRPCTEAVAALGLCDLKQIAK